MWVVHLPDSRIVWQVRDQCAYPPVGQESAVEVEEIDPMPQKVCFESFCGRLVREEQGDR